MITFENKKLHDLIVDKDTLVTEGRRISGEIDRIEIKIKRLEDKEKRITGKTNPPTELLERGEKAVAEITRLNVVLEGIVKEINDFKLAAVPPEIKAEHLELLKNREEKERDRNKIALKVQKVKDKVVPLIQKQVKPLLKEYDDVETAKTKDGMIVITTFNHLTDWKNKFHGR